VETLWIIVRIVVVAIIVVTVAGISKASPQLGAVLLSLPIISILAFLFSWLQHHDLSAVSRMARNTLVLVPLGLPFFLPFAFANRLGWNFWVCLASGIVLASTAIMTWVVFTASR
jgi:hypothetical protein